ncbi:glycosyltransferase family 2 protein [Flavobacterium defluvii]|uniref:Glycosyltransferase involved in cell wall bisynthesis n=1 Tax=Flavobacterium defluvii TaxID=370979 RepID=A0A1M5NYV5_9FLAO|nr:glycosyltransferase family 2 protein [Flavobacterium defluvii]SHG94163.1 Glycosyltransferase involved in cell wall bisynthesis [Flavobacterium defluvii]
MLPKISIITVVYNDHINISRTIESVINQSYGNIEYLIIDGGSTDTTLDNINKYINNIDVFVSEKDNGIYDAMNKGIGLCSGDWILFLNSGDFFHDKNILDKISGYIEQNKNVDIIYGNYNVLSENLDFSFVRDADDIENIKKDMVFSHQACLIKRTIHQKNYYNLKYKICADYDFLLKSYLEGAVFLRISEEIATISNGGLSDINRIKVFKERLKIKNTLIPSLSNYFNYFKSTSYLYLVGTLKKLMPNSFFVKFYKLKYKITGAQKENFNQSEI